MKRLLTILLVLLSAASFGQKHVYFGPPNTIDSFNLTMWVRQFKMPTTPLLSPFWDSAGSVYLNVPDETIYFHNGLVWQPIAGGSGGGGLQHPGAWLVQRGDTVDLDSANRVTRTLSGATHLTLPTAKTVSDALSDTAAAIRGSIPSVSGLATTGQLADSMGVVRDSLAVIRSAIPSLSGYATTSAVADSVSGRVKYSDTATVIATKAGLNGKQNFSDTSTYDATRSWVISQGYGVTTTLTSGTGISVTGSAPTYTVTNTAPDQTVSLTGAGTVSVTGTYPTFTVTGTGGSGGVESITSTGSTAIISGTTTVNVEVDTTHPFTFTGTNTFTRDITVDSVNIGSGGQLSTNVRFGRNAFPSATTSTRVIAIGENVANKVTTGTDITLVGHGAGANTSVSVNGLVGVGRNVLNYSTGDNNTAIGTNCMARAVAWNGIANVGVGPNSGNALTSGSSNTWIGSGAANLLTSGSSNTFLGISSGSVMTTGGQNVIIGAYTGNSGGLDMRTLSNRIIISDGAGNIRAYHTGTNWLIGTVTDGSTGILQLSGSLGLNTAGNKINIATGTNASVGTGTLSGGTATINTTAVTASSIIQVQLTSCSSCGTLYIGTVTAGTSFVVTSTNGSDASTFNYWIIN